MSRLVFNRNGGSADEYGHLLALSRLLVGDVIQGMTVTQDTGTNMAARVQAGTARISQGSAPGNYGFFVGIDTSGAGEQVTITTANASNPRNDLIVAFVDLGVAPSSATPNNPNNMLKLIAVAGTPAATPADPSTSAIQSAVGASNPYIVLARVRVGAAVTQITTANCTDLRSIASALLQNPAAFSVYRNTAWTNSATPQLIPFDTKNYDSTGCFDLTTNLFTARVAGRHHFTAQTSWNSPAAGRDFFISLYVNGVEVARGTRLATGGSSNHYVNVSKDLKLSVGDTVGAYINTPGTLAVTEVGQAVEFFEGFFVSAS